MPNENKTVRCAIYTRKSSDEGLNMEFNTLDAQREAAEAYIASQRSEGWVCLPDKYDDGGFSGGNMKRPALKRLTEDIKAGKVDCVVVYKVDRLSRSLLDFTKLLETFEMNNTSFVSVTQQFNSTSSMGRLTLNILLSFAQFEREIDVERIRDKVRAAKRKGKWMGGSPVLGYDVAPEGGKLLINEGEAAQVREIFRMYLEHRGVLPVVRKLKRLGWTSKRHTSRSGRVFGGLPYTKALVTRMLHNHLYIGEIASCGEYFHGEHEAIVSKDIWDDAQKLLRLNTVERRNTANKYNALLKGLLFCETCGKIMTHTYSQKGNYKQYRYYTCQTAMKQGWDACETKNVSAPAIEATVVEQLRSLGKNKDVLEEVIKQLEVERQTELTRLDTEIRVLQKDGGTDKEKLERLESKLKQKKQTAANIISPEQIKSDLLSFDETWEAMNHTDRENLVHLVIDKIYYNGKSGIVRIMFNHAWMKEEK